MQTASKEVRVSEGHTALKEEYTAFKWVPVEEAIATAAHEGIKHDFEAFRKARALCA